MVLCCVSGIAFADCGQAVGRLESSEGAVAIEVAGSWQALVVGGCIPADTRVQVSGGRAVFRLANETLLRASGGTLLRFSAPQEKNWIYLFDGLLHFITRTPHAFDLQTDYINAGVKGTEFILAANRAEHYGEVVVMEGEVLAGNAHGQHCVRGGGAVIAQAGKAPQLLTTVALRNAVQWTLYYPPLPFTQQPRFQPVVERLQRSDNAGAIQQWETLPASARDADYYALGAAINLQRGETTRARGDLDRALALQPQHPQALALSAVAAIALGDGERAAQLIERAQASAPRDTAVLIARSYLQQARFQLPAALASAKEAAAIDPASAQIQARIAELALMNDDTRLADGAANNAIKLQPELARAHAIAGFVHLQRLDFDDAATAFRRAIELDATDSMPRLGLGLVEIRHNRVAEGREQLALAVALDPGQSLLRSYLGKAYQEEGRERLASDQYALAKTLDSADPTPWFYSALLARVQNRPFDALDDLNRSIALNDNRAVYRSRLQLDADEAARTASQADIYRELGFDTLAQRSAARAVSTAPAEYGGHRQLAEAYADDPQYDAARSSEVLQAQLLQPLSATPILPLLGETNLLATEGAGPAELGFREYNAMFVREKPWLSVSALGGSNSTGADEISLSGIVDRFSYALNQYHYETNGYRDNNDARYDVLSAYTKFQATEDLSLLLQVSRREEDRGDIVDRLYAEVSPLVNFDSRSDKALIGTTFSLSPGINLLAVFSYEHEEITDIQRFPNIGFDVDINQDVSEDTSNVELQAQFDGAFSHGLVGADWAESDGSNTLSTAIIIPAQPAITFPDERIEDTPRYRSGYGYWTVTPLNPLELTIGLAYAELDVESLSRKLSGWYPKFGASYQIHPSLEFRAAYFQSLARPSAMEQTIEPTQLAGFNQFSDETAGVESNQYALGLGWNVGGGNWLGGEVFSRKSDLPDPLSGAMLEAKQHQASLYWYWDTKPWAVSLSYEYEKSEYENAVLLLNVPTPLRTQRIPLQVKWFSANGLTISATATYFDQDAEFGSSFIKRGDNFTLLNVAATYKIWNRRAEVELRCSNLSDKKFSYQSTDLYDLTSPQISPYIPERAVQFGIKFAL